LGFIHRRDRQLSPTANRFLELLQNESVNDSTDFDAHRLESPTVTA
jgi:hypothetical protein